MNTLRRIEADWRKQSKTEWIDQGSRIAHGICAKELSSAIPAWERLEKAVARTVERMSGPVGVDATDLHELREALEGVKAK